ncbi:MAG: hypothetical protein A3A57_02855 [Candidatus Woykebacteria bacterium RIFCSPLOWO2_01_FULL_41_12]|uniref:Uncharacterized protein n=1 Tax=Candidatus Woykebacteria bacterium RIFCSPLOWO2_01_FULL_41_12 TaxID=1802604 RepID=A0A1G1WVM0_9BACT|nr:MAG: hypothetical protein A3A57_02855 [Candidatus Woykebacteria bacterium RIFCSPLOWO2_01_FULL_41_12]
MKNLTIQEYIALSQDSISAFSNNFLPILTNILAAAVAVGVGVLIGWLLKRVIDIISDTINLEKSLLGLGFYQKITKSHDNLDLTNFVGEVARWSAIIVFLIAAIASLQIEGSDAIFSQLFAYITNVVLASVYLIFGFVIAWFVHRAITAVGTLIGSHPSHLVANVAYIAVIVFSFLQALMQLGVNTEFIRLGILATLVAGALAFGLAGKDVAADWIKKASDRAK